MRTLIILLALLPVALQAAQTPRGTVFAYECKQVNKLKVGFTCHFKKNGELHLQWHIKPAEMSEAERERPVYEFEKIAIRYMQLGGRDFGVGFDHWPKDKVRGCFHSKKNNHDYYCNSD